MDFSASQRDAVPSVYGDSSPRSSKRLELSSSKRLARSGSTKRKPKYPPLYERKRQYQLNFNYNFTQKEAQEVFDKGESSLQAVEALIMLLLNAGDAKGDNDMFASFNPMQSPLMSGKSPASTAVVSPRAEFTSDPQVMSPERFDSIMSTVYYSDCAQIFGNIKRYMKKSTLYTFWNGKRIGPEEIDSVLYTFTIVNALLLWLPFNMIGYLSFGFWDWFQNTLDYCPNTVTIYLQVYNSMENALFINLFGSVCGILIAILYFICRPTDVEKFHGWWRRGRWGVLLNILFTLTSIVGIMTNFTLMTTSYVNSSANLCASYSSDADKEHYQSAYSIAFIVLGISIALSFLVMI